MHSTKCAQNKILKKKRNREREREEENKGKNGKKENEI